MTEPDKPRTGSCYIWTVSCFLFICIVAGGTLLALYINQPPDSPDTSYAVGGVILVCLPWFFWFITFLYRLISRACGFRMVCWGAPFGAENSVVAGGGAGGGDTNMGGFGGGGNDSAIATGTSTNDGRHVRFGEATVVGEQNNGNDSISSRSSSQSHESEMPLKLSMAS